MQGYTLLTFCIFWVTTDNIEDPVNSLVISIPALTVGLLAGKIKNEQISTT